MSRYSIDAGESRIPERLDFMARINLYFDRIEKPILLLTEKIQKRIDAKIKDRSPK